MISRALSCNKKNPHILSNFNQVFSNFFHQKLSWDKNSQSFTITTFLSYKVYWYIYHFIYQNTKYFNRFKRNNCNSVGTCMCLLHFELKFYELFCCDINKRQITVKSELVLRHLKDVSKNSTDIHLYYWVKIISKIII